MPHRLEKSVGIFAIASLVVIGGTFLYRSPRMVPPNPYAAPRKVDSIERQIRTGVRQVYPYSVVPGGVFNPIEVIAAARNDKVVEEHYGGIELKKLAPVVLKQPRTAYVSYRKGDRVYWTRKPVVIQAGEAVLTDGREKIRARCGNRISDVPRLPVADAEPTPAIETLTPTDEVAVVAEVEDALEEAGLTDVEGQQLISFSRLPYEQGTDWWPIFPGGGGVPGGGPGGSGGGGGGGGGGMPGGGGDAGGTDKPDTPETPPDQPADRPTSDTPPGGGTTPDTPGVPSVPPVQPNLPGAGSDLPGYPPSIPPYIPQVPGPTPTDDGPKPLINEPGPSGGSGDSTIPLVPGSPDTPATPTVADTPRNQGTPDQPGTPTVPEIPKEHPSDHPEEDFRPVPEPRMVVAIGLALAGLVAWRYRKRLKPFSK